MYLILQLTCIDLGANNENPLQPEMDYANDRIRSLEVAIFYFLTLKNKNNYGFPSFL